MTLPIKSNVLLCRQNLNSTPMPNTNLYWCILVDEKNEVSYEKFVFGVEREA